MNPSPPRSIRRIAALVCATACLAGACTSGAVQPPRQNPQGALGGTGVRVGRATGTPELPDDLSARSWLVADAASGDVLAARNAHRRLPPASTLKVLFALTVLPKIPPATTHTVTAADLENVGEGSSRVGLEPGLDYGIGDLWRGVFLSSGNDAVQVLARMNGSVEATVRQMQAKAQELGAHDTRVVSPDGYDAPGQVSSAYDLALFARAGLADPAFSRYCSTAAAWFPGVGPSGAYRIQNTNRLLSGTQGVEAYPGLVGVKNGYTTKAGNTLVAAARRDGRTVIVTVMDPRSGKSHAVYEEARALLDWGFGSEAAEPVGSLDAPSPPAASPAAHRGRTTVAAQQFSVTRWGIAAAALAITVVGFVTWRRRARRPRDRSPSRP
ncbi:D-alanyl-D-alanine carboxypeptidase family protein [Streptomyces meridianus]|uniref:Serine hydrolase n=1 Tax=Streptomyces meridianus TaxID=2938945 RepID=A0ABT0XCR1_9ACTN|nr:serine hydrolase [Streptomyces meridianus]MCM2580314.1 serine hydrolase [Streptomyces meridianus]